MYRCEKCGGTGEYINSLGIPVTCECVLKKELNQSEPVDTITAPIYHVDTASAMATVDKMLIPEGRIGDDFNPDMVKENIATMQKRSAFEVIGLDEYIDLLSSIMTSIAINKKIKKSYLIGSPNGFGKTSFANSCIKVMDKRGQKAVPYISLYELAEIRAENERRLLGKIKKASVSNDYGIEDKKPTPCIGSFSWSEYMNADILFTYLSSVVSKEVESQILKMVLDIRSAKGLPTIVFTSTGIKPYLYDKKLFEYVWSEILAYNDRAGYDRLIHISTYKRSLRYIEAKEGLDY